MTVGQHTDHISSGQRVSRHSLPTLCFLFFVHPHFLKTILANRISGTTCPAKAGFAFADTQSQTKNAKEPPSQR
ncbi:MAG TPA: hypothetical protein PKD39_05755, partial [Chitinophagales bacterium]|nr:hypothetical protein [Chitinophagales bacterium]